MLTEVRKGEIALMIFRMRIRMDGIRIGKNFRREVGNTAKELGISAEEAMEFMESMTQELMLETFANKKNGTGTKTSDA